MELMEYLAYYNTDAGFDNRVKRQFRNNGRSYKF